MDQTRLNFFLKSKNNNKLHLFKLKFYQKILIKKYSHSFYSNNTYFLNNAFKKKLIKKPINLVINNRVLSFKSFFLNLFYF